MIIDVYLIAKSRRLDQEGRSTSRKGNKFWGPMPSGAWHAAHRYPATRA